MQGQRVGWITFVTIAVATACHQTPPKNMPGDLVIDEQVAAQTAVLRVQNSSNTAVRFFMMEPEEETAYVARALPGQTRSWALSAERIPANSVSFELRPDKGRKVKIGPYRLRRNETLDVFVPGGKNARITAVIRQTTRP